jgi:hypothetical protein
MSKERYTIRTEGSRTVIHWEGTAEKVAVRSSNIGRFVDDASALPKTTVREAGKDAKKP